MSFYFKNLNDQVRALMKEEVLRDENNGTLYISPRLNNVGKLIYSRLFIKNIMQGNDVSFAKDVGKFLKDTIIKNGKVVSMPSNADEMLAQGEFNRFYIRALCRLAIDTNKKIKIYRAKNSFKPRKNSETKIGKIVNPEALLEDLRSHPGLETILGLPTGPNSGISVEIVEEKQISLQDYQISIDELL